MRDGTTRVIASMRELDERLLASMRELDERLLAWLRATGRWEDWLDPYKTMAEYRRPVTPPADFTVELSQRICPMVSHGWVEVVVIGYTL